jgi:hypothetical protein
MPQSLPVVCKPSRAATARCATVILLGLWTTLLCPGTARADIISRDAGAFFSSAASVAELRVQRVLRSGAEVKVKVLRVLRGTAPGTTISAAAGFSTTRLRAGQRLLYACSASLCVLGTDQGDHYLLHPMLLTPAEVRPGVVEKRALPALMQGKPAPDICLQLQIDLVDEPQQPARLRLVVSARDGVGKQGLLLVQEGRTLVTLGRAGAEVVLTGPPPGPARRGCRGLRLRPTRPPARTRRALDRARAGKLSTMVLARGAIVIHKVGKVGKVGKIRKVGAWPPPGRYPLTVAYTRRRGAVYQCRLFRHHAPHQTHSALSGKMLSFPAARRGRYVSLVGGFPRGRDLLRLAQALSRGAVRWPVRLHGVNGAGKVVGSVKLRRVPDAP